MPADNYLSLVNGEQQAKPGRQTGDPSFAGNLVALNDEGFLNESLLDEKARSYIIVETALAFGSNLLVNFYSDGGFLSARIADASLGYEAHGFSPEGKGAGLGPLTVYLNGTFESAGSGMTPGAEQYLYSDGAFVETPTESTGHVLQSVGFAIDATTLRLIRSTPVPILAS